MSVNPELLDTVFEPTEAYVVGREKVREFASAVFATATIHHDVDAAIAEGYSDVVAPPTFPIVIQEKTLQQLLSHPGAGIDFSRVVHGDQKFEYQRPMVAGDEVVATLRVTKIQSLRGHTMLTSESSITTTAGEPVVVATSTLVIRGEEG
ncbi:MAG: MaoC family dehydratase N-terminal domain-containing protein [Pontimonas sp.]